VLTVSRDHTPAAALRNKNVYSSVRGLPCHSLSTVENHGNTEITKAVIFVKCRDFAKMPCFAVFLAEISWFYRF